MSNISDNTLNQLDALNHWLGDVYGEETRLSTLLMDAGFSETEIEQITQEHLSEFLQAVIDLLDSDTDFPREHYIMIQHYGLIDGKSQDFYAIGHSVGVCGERIRQLVNKGLSLYRDPVWQAKFRADFAAIGRRLLDNEGSSQE